MLEICELCKVFSNPLRLEILSHIYQAKDGFNFGLLVDQMQKSKLYAPGLCASGVNQYLRELVRLGIVRRRREGRHVDYYADLSHATTSIAKITSLVVTQMKRSKNRNFARVFPALMNPFRAHVIRLLAKTGPLSPERLCARTKHQPKRLQQDLKFAFKANLIAKTYSSTKGLEYCYRPPKDSVGICLMEHLLKSGK